MIDKGTHKWFGDDEFAILNKKIGNRNEYQRKYRYSTISRRIAHSLRKRLNRAIRQKTKVGSAINDCGCSQEFLKEYLESQFQCGMTWNNYGLNGWNIDHIIPLSYFDLSDKEQFLRACHYTNLQPMWASENKRKGAKYTHN